MIFHVLTILPDVIQSFFNAEFKTEKSESKKINSIPSELENKGLVSTAIKNKIFDLNLVSLRDFANNKYKSVDNRPFGGGDGMVFEAEVLSKAMDSLKTKVNTNTRVVYLSPQGRLWNQKIAKEYSEKYEHLVLICGRYGGIDQRFINTYVDEEISVGDYVLSGGEMAAAVLIDSIARCLPGTLGNERSYLEDSFQGGVSETVFLEAPIFTRPANFLDQQVPEVLLSGDHNKIKEWKHYVGILVTLLKRPDLIDPVKQKKDVEKALEYAGALSDQELRTLGLDKLDLITLSKTKKQ